MSQLKQAVFAVQQSSPLIQEGIKYLEEHLHEVHFGEKVVCHCDVNHNNWLLSEDNQLYLIDWDGAMIADPAMDLGPLLYQLRRKASLGELAEHVRHRADRKPSVANGLVCVI